MKTLFSFCLILAVIGTIGASPACERLAHYDAQNLQKSFMQDLVSNVWNTTVLGDEATLYFAPDGSLLAIPSLDSRVEEFHWSVEVHEGQGLLYIVKPTDLRVFSLAPTCSGLCVSEGGSCSMMTVDSDHSISEERYNFVRSQLFGTWKYAPSRKDARTGPDAFSLTLKNDGTFLLATGPDDYHSSMEGSWELAPDGTYLIISTRHDRGGQEFYVPESLTIQSIDYEDLVIDSETLPQILEKSTMKQPLYLSKSGT
jgi:hypothetical protein